MYIFYLTLSWEGGELEAHFGSKGPSVPISDPQESNEQAGMSMLRFIYEKGRT